MKIDFAARVDIGPKATNDDRVLVSGQILDMNFHSGTFETPAVAAVCDGCGGYAGGGIAAQTVLEVLSSETAESLTDVNCLSKILASCKNAVMEKKSEMPQYSAMCTTIAGCVFGNDSISVFHSGDSRVYRYDGWALAKMTRDHSLVQEMIDYGEITPEEVYDHPQRNVISRCIGIDGPAPEIYVSHSSINPGEKYLFCSDGLWEVVRDFEMKEILDSELTVEQMANALVDKALANGAYDNISVCILAAEGTVAAVEDQPFILD